MIINNIQEVLKPYFDGGLVRIIYENSEVCILNAAESEYVSVYKNTAAEQVWGLLIPKEDLREAAQTPYQMIPKYSIDLSCQNQVVLFDDDYYARLSELKNRAGEDDSPEDIDPEKEEELRAMTAEAYDCSQKLEYDKSAKPKEKTFQKCIVADRVDDAMVKEDLNLNSMGLLRTVILWLMVAGCLYQFGRWIPSLERILEILCAVCIFKAGTDLFLMPRRKKEGSRAKIRIQYHICLKKFYTGAEADKKFYILTDSWDVFEVTDITNHQVLRDGERIGYVFVDGRMVKDFFYVIDEEKN